MSAIRNLPPHAMAKNESTAVNDLINLVSTQVPRKPAPEEDLMFAEPAKHKVEARPPRMTGTVPAMRGAGAVEPLPAGRGGKGTSQLRITTAPPSRQTTIPPIGSSPAIPPPRPASAPAITPPVIASSPELPIPVRPTRPSLPPPTRSSAPAARTTAPASMPVAAPFEANPYAAPPVAHTPSLAPADLTDQTWFEESRAVDRVTGPIHEDTWVGTVQVPKQASTAHWLRKLAPAMGGMIVLGMFVGGFIAFDGEGGHKRASQPTPPPAPVASAPVAAPAAVAAPASEPVAAPVPEPAAAAPAPVAATEPTPVTPPNLAVAMPAAAAAPAVAAPAIAKGRPVFVDVRIDSRPEGATVMLVDRGKTTFLGSTPISTALDPARTYDVVFTYANRPTQVEHLDPRTQSKLAVTLGRSGNAVVPAVAKSAPALVAPAIKVEPKVEAPRVEAPKKVEKAEKAEKAEKVEKAEKAEKVEPKAEKAKVEVVEPKAEKAIAAPAPKAEKPPAPAAGQGVLMISSKPPCEIYVDGKATGLTTPQRSLPMSVGPHKITLVNKTEKITKTLSVQISAEKPTKVIQDLMQ